jgi:hypothetical protein
VAIIFVGATAIGHRADGRKREAGHIRGGAIAFFRVREAGPGGDGRHERKGKDFEYTARHALLSAARPVS